MRSMRWRAACASGTAVLLVACAAQVPVAPATLVPLSTAQQDVVLDSDVPVRLTTAYTRTIPAKIRWQAIGSLPQGVVFRPVGSVFAIEGRQIHEAYLVLRGSALQGFFLPGEGNYSALPAAIQLPIHTGGSR